MTTGKEKNKQTKKNVFFKIFLAVLIDDQHHKMRERQIGKQFN